MDLTADNLMVWKYILVVSAIGFILVAGKFVQLFVKAARKTSQLPKSDLQRKKRIIFLAIAFFFFIMIVKVGLYVFIVDLLKFF